VRGQVHEARADDYHRPSNSLIVLQKEWRWKDNAWKLYFSYDYGRNSYTPNNAKNSLL
jgi:hypothetical protein